MDTISDLRHIATWVDHTQPDLMISGTILASTWITSDLDIIGPIVPEISDRSSLRIIGAISTQIDRAGQSIAVELIGIDLLIVGLDLTVEFEDDDRRIGISTCYTRQRTHSLSCSNYHWDIL